MKTKRILIVEDEAFSRTVRRKNQIIQRHYGKERSLPLQRGIFFVLILFLLTLFIIRISEAQEAFPKRNKPTLRMDSQGSCWKSFPFTLPEEQKKALDSLRRSYMAEATPIRTDLFALRIQLRYLLLDPNVQPEILFYHQRKISGLHAKLEELSLCSQVKARSIFTKGQLGRLPQGWASQMGLGHEIPTMGIGRRFNKGLQ